MKKVSIFVFIILLYAFFALSTGCGTEKIEEDSYINSVDIVESSVTINRFQTEKLNLSDVNGDEMWSSSDEKIVSVDKGILIGKSAGSAVITCERNNVKDTCFVVVKDNGYIPVIETGIISNEININKGQSFQLNPHVKFMGEIYDDCKFTYEASNEGVDIHENGVIIGLNVGTSILHINGIWNGFTMPSLNTIIKINVVNI